MKLSTVVIVLLTRALIGELAAALNVTVTPGPVSMCMEGDNITLSCLVSQKKRSSSLLVLRWLYLPTPEDEHLVVRMGMKKAKYYGNYSKRFPQTKFLLWEEMDGQIFRLMILNVTTEDGGNYTCKVQEIRKHRNKWRSSANGTGSMELRVHHIPSTRTTDVIWRMFEDLYLCAVLICSIGLICIFVFAMTITCQHLQQKRRLQASYYLVKCPENSSGETVTSVASSSPAMHRKEKRHKPEFRDITSLHYSTTPVSAPQIPAKAPVPRKPRRTKLLKPQHTKTHMSRVADDSLTYAELELVKPKPELKTDSTGCPQLESNTNCMGTVYAQILFVEKQV
ncbi:V-set and transmembrane domain-containing protein 4a [Triplophysa rosa]|uniref:V-set and transmembrane domain-containing protein 4 n=1 Tax=Triplophysa rosa TaxID=992332 RepID=A0A9W7WPG4_TRIRA|nr:V-set and transmembrane domain-containing protein 4a [Triplophysa rosa]KAI7805906.1 putative V-set and transmembrane domain-containing protein 4 [Triplophysa rosa]